MSKKAYLEKRKHSTEAVPFSYYKSKIPDYSPSIPLHWHSEFELNRILYGEGEFICGNNRLICNAGDIIIIPPDALHSFYLLNSKPLYYDTLVFNSNMLYSNIGERSYIELILPLVSGKITISPKIDKSYKQYPDLLKSTDYVFQHAKSSTSTNDILLKGELLHIFGILFENNLYSKSNITSKNILNIIRPALEHIKKYYNKNITIPELAKISHLSQSYLMSCFKNALGISAIEYICQLRIKLACEMLRDSELNISDIAFECGFANLSNFNRQFKKRLGTPPSEYRKKCYKNSCIW